MPEKLRIACIGEAMIELSSHADATDMAKVAYAGDTLNTAVYLKRALNQRNIEAEVHYVTRVGQDRFSEQMLGMMREEHLQTELIEKDSHRLPGIYAISTDELGERRFSYWRNESAARLLFQPRVSEALAALNEFQGIYWSAITLAILPANVRNELLHWLADYRRQPGRWVAFDSNYRPALWEDQSTAENAINNAWQQCDIALPSIDDEIALFDDESESDLIQRFKSYGITRGALKRGRTGPTNLFCDNPATRLRSLDSVVDSTAAGDSFNGAYLAALISGCDEQTALIAGHDCAIKVISHPGAIIPKF
ncbi:MAG: sugar kinase [Granulosicoccus sp.]